MYNNNVQDFITGVSHQDIETFQQKYGIKLPDEVTQYYSLYNGGRLEKSLFVKNDDQYIVNYFIPLMSVGEAVGEVYEDLQDVLPDGIIPFADDLSGNLFCFSIRDYDCGTIHYYDHEYDYGENPKEHFMYLSESLSVLIDSMIEYVEE